VTGPGDPVIKERLKEMVRDGILRLDKVGKRYDYYLVERADQALPGDDISDLI
jgi:hypothetical protein